MIKKKKNSQWFMQLKTPNMTETQEVFLKAGLIISQLNPEL